MKRLNHNSCCAPGASCCGPGAGSCEPPKTTREITIDFLYLDLETCDRCRSTDSSLDEALDAVSQVLSAAGYAVKVNKVKIDTSEMAVHYQFLSSPTIRINGADIMPEVLESNCGDCGDICGDSVDCRVWEYDGALYNQPPRALIVDAILKEVYGGGHKDAQTDYKLPENLKKFFDSLKNKKV